MIRSIELNWLSKKDKSCPLPELAFYYDNSDTSVSGSFHHPFNGVLLYDEKSYDGRNGIIEINLDCCNEKGSYESILAHEWRHCWQCQYSELEAIASWNNLILKYDYYTAIRLYYELNSRERDALLYECKMYPNDQSLYNLSLLEYMGKEKYNTGFRL